MTDRAPPAVLERLVRLASRRGQWADIAIGDLREEFAAIARHRRLAAARAWYAGETAGLFAAAAARALTARSGGVSGSSGRREAP